MVEEPATEESNLELPLGGTPGAIAPAGIPLPHKGPVHDLSAVTDALTDSQMVDAFADVLGELETDLDELGCTDRLATLEKLKAAASAAEVKATARFAELSGKRRRGKGLSLGEEVGLARHEAPTMGLKLLRCSTLLAEDMPMTLAALGTGFINEQKALIIAEGAATLTPKQRAVLDATVHEDPLEFTGEGVRALADRVKAAAQDLDPDTAVADHDAARTKRYLNLYPAADGMFAVHGSIPAESGVLIAEILEQLAASAKASGDHRTLTQLRADEACDLLTGAGRKTAAPICVSLVMTGATLFMGDTESAYLQGYGSIPAAWARWLIKGAERPDRDMALWFQRIYTAPGTGELLAMDSTKRRAPGRLREMIGIRDRTCQTPFCDCRGAQLDHVLQWARGGPTSAVNAVLRNVYCNLAKEEPGWVETPITPKRHGIEIQTPSGATYQSMAPPLPGTRIRQ